MTQKVFGYQRFPTAIFRINSERRFIRKFENNEKVSLHQSTDSQEAIYDEITSDTAIYFSTAQTSVLRHVFIALAENISKDSPGKCTLGHLKCKYTRLEHFLYDVKLNFATHSTKKKVDSIKWLTDLFVQRFYNGCVMFREFADSLLTIVDFRVKVYPELIDLCWSVYQREFFEQICNLNIVEDTDIITPRLLFDIFTFLDANMSCKLDPFIFYHLVTWWQSESGIKSKKELQTVHDWYEKAKISSDTHINYPEFLKQIFRVFLSGVPRHLRKTLIEDAHDSMIKGIIKQGLLEKTGANNKRWLNRLFVLYDDRIDYFKKTQTELSKKGSIELGKASSVVEILFADKNNYFQFSVVCTNSKRCFFLRTDDLRIRHTWVTTIQMLLDIKKGSLKPCSLEKTIKFIDETIVIRSTNRTSRIPDANTLDGKQIVRADKRFSAIIPDENKFTCDRKRSTSFQIEKGFVDSNNPSNKISSASTTFSVADQYPTILYSGVEYVNNTINRIPDIDRKSSAMENVLINDMPQETYSSEDETSYTSMENALQESSYYVIAKLSLSNPGDNTDCIERSLFNSEQKNISPNQLQPSENIMQTLMLPINSAQKSQTSIKDNLSKFGNNKNIATSLSNTICTNNQFSTEINSLTYPFAIETNNTTPTAATTTTITTTTITTITTTTTTATTTPANNTTTHTPNLATPPSTPTPANNTTTHTPNLATPPSTPTYTYTNNPYNFNISSPTANLKLTKSRPAQLLYQNIQGIANDVPSLALYRNSVINDSIPQSACIQSPIYKNNIDESLDFQLIFSSTPISESPKPTPAPRKLAHVSSSASSPALNFLVPPPVPKHRIPILPARSSSKRANYHPLNKHL